MSADTVDDLHAAEDHAGVLAAALRELLDALGPDAYPSDLDEARQSARVALTAHATACRPTCSALNLEDGECLEGFEHCGCPCHNTNAPPE